MYYYNIMTFGFVMIRHVCNEISDLYWKESYHCIRKWYPETPIMIVDDSSKKEFLKEDIELTNCTVIYDTTHKGSAELLPYYYFHLHHPFEKAIIIHDSIFIQRYIDFTEAANEPCRFLWTFPHYFDEQIVDAITEVCSSLRQASYFMNRYHDKNAWSGCFGAMSIIQWDFLDHINQTEDLFANWLPRITTRHYRHALERCISVVLTQYCPNMKEAMFGDIFKYIRWGVTFDEYKVNDCSAYPIIKVWSSR